MLHPPPTPAFNTKKATILASIATHTDPNYTDNSPKGTIDAEIIDLIDEINAAEGYVTTSSCAGRVAVFVEGRKKEVIEGSERGGEQEDEDEDAGLGDGGIDGGLKAVVTGTGTRSKTGMGAGPGGKGFGNKWLYVSHEPVPSIPQDSSGSTTITTTTSYHDLFNLTPSPSSSTSTTNSATLPSNPRLIKLTFSPLILHILCSSLHTAKPLLAAAINAGFRESGVQSLKILERNRDGDGDGVGAGVMLAIRTAGCGFESVIGYVEENCEGEEGEVYRSVVSEEWLRVLVGIASGRFGENVGRRERLRREMRGTVGVGVVGDGNGDGVNGRGGKEWEDKEARWRRKREEGLRFKKEVQNDGDGMDGEKLVHGGDEDGLGGGLFLEST